MWIIGGDSNAVKRSSERVGISISRSISEWREFKDFILIMGLLMYLVGAKNTCGILEMVNLKVE